MQNWRAAATKNQRPGDLAVLKASSKEKHARRKEVPNSACSLLTYFFVVLGDFRLTHTRKEKERKEKRKGYARSGNTPGID